MRRMKMRAMDAQLPSISCADGLLRLFAGIESLGGGLYRARPLNRGFEHFEGVDSHPIEALNRLREAVDVALRVA
jgi:hypothetical protein